MVFKRTAYVADSLSPYRLTANQKAGSIPDCFNKSHAKGGRTGMIAIGGRSSGS